MEAAIEAACRVVAVRIGKINEWLDRLNSC
jgi:type II secretory pathway component PulL